MVRSHLRILERATLSLQHIPGTIILQGIGGSRAYGMETPDSDWDRKGIFALPTQAWFGLRPPNDQTSTIHETGPDITFHEAYKAVLLLLKVNPTVSELLRLETYEVCTPFGAELVLMRSEFLHAARVRDAFMGYAAKQLKLLATKSEPEKFDPTDTRRAKHARHLMRLIQQGYQLYTEGDFSVRVDNREELFEFGRQCQEMQTTDAAVKLVAEYDEKFRTAKTALPEQPNYEPIEDWLIRLRRSML